MLRRPRKPELRPHIERRLRDEHQHRGRRERRGAGAALPGQREAMKINIVGAGPGGLYFALLMKKHDPASQITIYEQNPPDATYGWGIVLSDRALSFLQRADSPSYADLMASLELWHDQILVLRGERVAGHGTSFSRLPP